MLVPPTRRSEEKDPGAREEMASSPSSGRSLHPSILSVLVELMPLELTLVLDDVDTR